MKKRCNKCGIEYPINHYCVHRETADGKSNICRTCKNKHQRLIRGKTRNKHTIKYEKTEKGFLMRLYRNMKSRIFGVQKEKYHLYAGKELLDKNLFYEWALSNKEFKSLFAEYTNSGYNRKLSPSVDRIDSSLGYTLGNIRFITHSQNSKYGNMSKRIKYGMK